MIQYTLGLAGLAFAGTAYGQACQTTTLRSTVPSNGTEVALQSYSYCGGTLNATAYIANVDYDKIVSLYYTDGRGESTPLSVVTFNYQASLANNFELWSSSTPIYIDGITKLLNLTFQATDIGETYAQVLNLAVNASGTPIPTAPSPPAPYATPKGFGDDITSFLSVNIGSEAETAFARMFLNINPAVPGAVEGVVVAARSGPSYTGNDPDYPDYEYDWVRDSSLTMDVVQALYAAATKAKPKTTYENILFEYAAGRATEQNDPGLQTGLGEPKFYLNNTIFSGPWGRPQNDGPATAAITLIEFANAYLANGGSIDTVKQKIYNSQQFPSTAPMQKDLLFVASNWSSPSFDLWEEEESDHFYTRMVQRRALIMGSAFATRMGDSSTAAILSSAATAISATLDQFWDPNRGILYEYGPVLHGKSSYLDIAVILGVIHGYTGDGVYGYTTDRVLFSALHISTAFIDVYPIANKTTDSAGRVLGIPIGRYPEDVYNGTGTQDNGGNPWYLATAAMAQFMYAASTEFADMQRICVTNVSKPFFDYFAPEAGLQAGQDYTYGSKKYNQAISSLNGWGDAFMRTVKFYTPADGHLSEEFNRNTGAPQGALDLTWSYASVLTAAFQRAELRGQKPYVKNLANLGITKNTS